MTIENNTPKLKLFPLTGFVAVIILRLMYILPFSFTRVVSRKIGVLLYKISAKKRNIVLTNLRFAYPDKSEESIQELALTTSQYRGQLLSEFPIAWLGSKNKIENLITNVENAELIEQAIADNQGIIVASPHIGNWEFMVQWIQINFPMVGLYSPSRVPQMDDIILWARSKFGGNPYPTNKKGILRLLRSLKKGGLMIMLPDQVPKPGGGVYVPFFGKPAYTMTLLQSFSKKTNAKILFAYCIRNENDKEFTIKIESTALDAKIQDSESFAIDMNQHIEKIINQYPEQYVWDYKRFKQQADRKTLY